MPQSARPHSAIRHFVSFPTQGSRSRPHRRKHDRSAQAFSIIELLVGFAVLAVVVSLLTAAFSNFSQVAATSTRRMEVNKQPRAMFDRMAFDVGSAVTSGGIRMQFRKDQGLPSGGGSKNDAMILLTDAKSPDPLGRMANVGYAVGEYTEHSHDMKVESVLRYVQALRWSDDTTKIDISNSNPSDINVQPIAPGILRFELAFAMKDGTILAQPPPDSPTNPEPLDLFYENLASIIVTVATLDEDSLAKLTPDQRTSIVNGLADATDQPAGGINLLTVWQAANFDGLPAPVKQGLRYHQRYFRVR